MTQQKQPLRGAVNEAILNGTVIFALSLGLAGFAKTTTPYISSEVSYQFLIMQSLFLALIRFATYLIQEDVRVSTGEIGQVIGYEKTNTSNFHSFFIRHKVGKVI